MTDYARPLAELAPQNSFFVGIDSDGCAFDTMGIKHSLCFTSMVSKVHPSESMPIKNFFLGTKSFKGFDGSVCFIRFSCTVPGQFFHVSWSYQET